MKKKKMTCWFVSRHEGAVNWAKLKNLPVTRWVSHLDIKEIHHGDVVIGVLPVHLAAAVCEKGAEFYFLTIDLELQQRGTELDMHEMLAACCRIQRYQVQSLD